MLFLYSSLDENDENDPAREYRQVADGGDGVELRELLAQRVIFRGGFKRSNLFLDGGGARFDMKGLEGGERQHDDQQGAGRDKVFPAQEELAEQRHGAAGEPPAEIGGEQNADDLSGHIATVCLENDRRQDEGEHGNPADPERDGKTVDYRKYLHENLPFTYSNQLGFLHLAPPPSTGGGWGVGEAAI